MMKSEMLLKKKKKELEDLLFNEQKDEGTIERSVLQTILLKEFKLEAKETDMFLYEMDKLSTQKSQSKISLRTIKDCINESRLDDGRVFLFITKSAGSTVNPAVTDADSSQNMSLLYNPQCYEPIESVACGACHLLLLTKSGEVYACGNSLDGALGIGPITEEVKIPVKVEIKKHKGTRKVQMIAAGREHSICLTQSKEVFTWGIGLKGRLGHGDEVDMKTPKEITMLHQFTPVFVAAGDSNSACISAAGKLFTWGDGQYGKLGHKSAQEELAPRRVDELMEFWIVQVSLGSFHTLAVDKEGKIFGFGQAKGGMLGTPEKPPEGPIPGIEKAIQYAVAGVYNSYGVDMDNTIFSWGTDDKKMLGRIVEKKSSSHIPKPISNIKLVKPAEKKGEGFKEAAFSSKIVQVIVCRFLVY